MRRLNYNYVFYFYSKAQRIDYPLLIERDISRKLDLNFFAQSIIQFLNTKKMRMFSKSVFKYSYQ